MSDLFIGLIKNICPKFGETAAAFLFVRRRTRLGRILRGEKQSDLPVVQSSSKLVVNLKTSKALGIELPPTSLALVDAVIKIAPHIAAVRHPNSD